MAIPSHPRPPVAAPSMTACAEHIAAFLPVAVVELADAKYEERQHHRDRRILADGVCFPTAVDVDVGPPRMVENSGPGGAGGVAPPTDAPHLWQNRAESSFGLPQLEQNMADLHLRSCLHHRPPDSPQPAALVHLRKATG